ncbi:MAG: HAMP domain-containing histidine kinase [Phycisphaerales bacterium]|nr:HAMP domain-containing histidine kinase [Phycisphaerales bacterium]
MSDTFNRMVQTLKESQDQLRTVNKTMDLKLVELSRSNVALHETNKIKNEFLANVSHELRTPLNSIVGFAEVLEETLRERTGPVDEKRKRYVANIIISSRHLLDLINDLLDLAKIEAGRMDLHIAPMSVADTVEGLVTLMRPQTERRKIKVTITVQPNLPMVKPMPESFSRCSLTFSPTL